MSLESRFESALISQLTRYGLGHFLESTRDVIVLIDVEGKPLAANNAFERLRGAAGAPDSIFDLIAPHSRLEARTCHESALRDHQPIRTRLDLGGLDSPISYEALIVPAEGDTSLFIAEPAYADSDLLAANDRLTWELKNARSDLGNKSAELHALLAQVDDLAQTDSLTLLPNRKGIVSSLQRCVTYAERADAPLAVSMLDLDGFKAVNDELGHSAGDQILVRVARSLREQIREPDAIGRYGGDEFLVILPNATALGAREQAARLCQRLREMSFQVGGRTWPLRLSVGISQLARGTETWQGVLDRADRALYEAKRLGGDQWVILES